MLVDPKNYRAQERPTNIRHKHFNNIKPIQNLQCSLSSNLAHFRLFKNPIRIQHVYMTELLFRKRQRIKYSTVPNCQLRFNRKLIGLQFRLFNHFAEYTIRDLFTHVVKLFYLFFFWKIQLWLLHKIKKPKQNLKSTK